MVDTLQDSSLSFKLYKCCLNGGLGMRNLELYLIWMCIQKINQGPMFKAHLNPRFNMIRQIIVFEVCLKLHMNQTDKSCSNQTDVRFVLFKAC
jgi:hypothetical protein